MKIIIDSGCDVNSDLIEQKQMEVSSVPLSLQVNDSQYTDDETLNKSEFISKMEAKDVVVRTAAPSPQQFLEHLKEEGSAFIITLSSKLSASYQNAMLAKDIYLNEFGQKFIHVFDSLSASAGETVIALKLNELIKANIPETEIVEKVTSFIDGMRTFFVLERYDNLVRNGRINAHVAMIASALSIRPICAADKGTMVMADKARGIKNAFKKLVDIMAAEALDFENRVLAISHVECLEKAEQLKQQIMQRINFREVVIQEATGLCSSYAQRGGIVVSY